MLPLHEQELTVRCSLRMLLPLLIGTMASCGGADKSTEPRGPIGLFQLVSIDGSPPAAGFGGSIEIRADDTFTYTERSGSATTFTSSGSYAPAAPGSTNFILLTVSLTSGGTAVGPCATKCTGMFQGSLQGNYWSLMPSPLPPSSGFGAGWRYY